MPQCGQCDEKAVGMLLRGSGAAEEVLFYCSSHVQVETRVPEKTEFDFYCGACLKAEGEWEGYRVVPAVGLQPESIEPSPPMCFPCANRLGYTYVHRYRTVKPNLFCGNPITPTNPIAPTVESDDEGGDTSMVKFQEVSMSGGGQGGIPFLNGAILSQMGPVGSTLNFAVKGWKWVPIDPTQISAFGRERRAVPGPPQGPADQTFAVLVEHSGTTYQWTVNFNTFNVLIRNLGEDPDQWQSKTITGINLVTGSFRYLRPFPEDGYWIEAEKRQAAAQARRQGIPTPQQHTNGPKPMFNAPATFKQFPQPSAPAPAPSPSAQSVEARAQEMLAKAQEMMAQAQVAAQQQQAQAQVAAQQQSQQPPAARKPGRPKKNPE